MRDSDALHFIKRKDWEIIELSFSKVTKGLFLSVFMYRDYACQIFKKYRRYSRAYYMEIIMRNEVESRTIFLFKEKFISSAQEIDAVLEMYVSIDDLETIANFMKSINVSPKRLTQLLKLAIKNDSAKVTLHLL